MNTENGTPDTAVEACDLMVQWLDGCDKYIREFGPYSELDPDPAHRQMQEAIERLRDHLLADPELDARLIEIMNGADVSGLAEVRAECTNCHLTYTLIASIREAATWNEPPRGLCGNCEVIQEERL